MTLDQGLAFIAFALVAAITPGPSNVMITATGAGVGVTRGLPCVVGAAVGMGSLLFCAALGLGQLVVSHPALLRLLHWCGTVFLLWLAWKIATAGRVSQFVAAEPVGFLGAALFQWINPKGWLVAMGAAGTYCQVTTASPVVQAAAFGVLFFAVACACGLLWLLLGVLVHRLLRDEQNARIFNIAMGVALAASVTMLLM